MSKIYNPAIKYFRTATFGENVKCLRCCLLPGGRLFLVENFGCHGYVFDPETHQWDTLEFDNPIHGVTLLKNHKCVVVTAGSKGFQEMNMKNFHTKQYQKAGGNFQAINQFGDKIAVHNDFRKLSVMDTHGNVTSTINTKYDPWYVTTDDHNCIFWTNGKHGEIHCEQVRGLKRFIHHNAKIDCPSGLTLDKRGALYVAGYDSHNIHKFSQDGQYQGEILRESDGIKHPYDIAFNNDKEELVVLNEDGAAISIYKL